MQGGTKAENHRIWNMQECHLPQDPLFFQGGFACDPLALAWKERRGMIMEEILQRKPDLIACQGEGESKNKKKGLIPL